MYYISIWLVIFNSILTLKSFGSCSSDKFLFIHLINVTWLTYTQNSKDSLNKFSHFSSQLFLLFLEVATATTNDFSTTLYDYNNEKLKVVLPGIVGTPVTSATITATTTPPALIATNPSAQLPYSTPPYRPFCSETFYKFLYIFLCTASFVLALVIYLIFRFKFKIY